MREAWVPFADRLDDSARYALQYLGRQQEVAAGTFLMHDGDGSRSVFLIIDGTIKVIKSSVEGKVSFISLRGPGTIVGEFEVFVPSDRSASVQAVTNAVVRRMSGDQYLSLLEGHPTSASAVIEDLIQRLREATDQIHTLMSSRALARIATLLVLLADETSTTEPSGTLSLALPVAQQEIGEWAGLSRAATVNALRSLRNRELIRTSRMSITVLDLPALREFAVT